MFKAKGPVWHKKHKQKNIIPKGLRGIDKEATWGYSGTKQWKYSHSAFCLTPFEVPVVGIFQWMPSAANEAKKMEQEIVKYEDIIEKVFMDSKADSQKRYFDLKRHQIQLVTKPRKGMDKSPKRQKMIKEMLTKENIKDYKRRSTTVEPIQGLVKEIFDLDVCWMRRDENNRWLFAAMGVAIQIAQLNAYKNNQSTFTIKQEVLGV